MFGKDFIWGVASSAYQIEGRDETDGCGECVWDSFIKAGNTRDGEDASVSCDHIHHYKEDFALMKKLGIRNYRFSLNWSRILPEGTGRVNEKAIALYRDMLLCMKENEITPYITLFHWEYPQALEKKGGWLNEQSPEWFEEYAKIVAKNFSDVCEYFITMNEPQCFCGLGHFQGVHAPGYKLPIEYTFRLIHNVLKAHGRAVKALRKYASRPIKVGFAPTSGVAMPKTNKKEDIEAARKRYFGFDKDDGNWTWNVSWYTDPVVLGHYPKEGLKRFASYLPEISEEDFRKDMEFIHQPIDFLGQNIYNGYVVEAGENGEPVDVKRKMGYTKTASDWPVTPECLYWGTHFLYERYRLPLYITENGMSCHDMVSVDGKVHDPNRITFLDAYLGQLQKAVDEGVDVRGYFLWTFLDNFEWEKGYNERFGTIYVDFETQERIPKDSAFWYKKVIETNGECLSINDDRRV